MYRYINDNVTITFTVQISVIVFGLASFYNNHNNNIIY
jgi:hypothetical protein